MVTDLLAPRVRRPSVADVLVPRTVPAAVAAPRLFPLVVRVACAVAVVVLIALFLLVTVSSALIALGDPSAATADTGPDSVQVGNYSLLLVGALLALLAAGGVGGRRAAGFPDGSCRRLPRLLLGGLATVYLPLVACTTAYVVIAASGAAPQPNSPRQSVVVGLAASVSSGIGEEVFVVAAPVAVLGPLVAVAARRSARSGKVASAALVLLLVAARLSYHLYYGPVVLVLVPWAVLTVMVYLRTRSVLPLMVWHVTYDALLQLPGFVGLAATVLVALTGAVAGAVAVADARDRTLSGGSAPT